jgi:hypothetical protein
MKIAEETGLQNRELQHPLAASLESHLGRPENERAPVAKGRHDAMEFYFFDARLCVFASETTRLDDAGPREWIARV